MSPICSVKQFVIEEFLPDTQASELDDDLDLIESGIVDSLGVLKLIAAIESQYRFTIEAELMQPENYKSVRAIETLIQRKLAVATA